MSTKEFNERVFDLLESTGLNWTVTKEALISSVDQAVTSSHGLFVKNTREHLSTVGDQYEVFQNKDLAIALMTAADGLNLDVTRGGRLYGTPKVYLQAQLPDEFVGKSGVKRWLTGLNSHGGGSIGFGSSNTVVICQNTYYRAYKELQKVRHTMTAKEKVETMAKELNSTLLKDTTLFEVYKEMANTPLRESLVEKVIRKLFDVEAGTKKTDVSTRKQNQLIGYSKALETEIKDEGETVWALFNSVTRYTNHVVNHKNAEERKTYLMAGNGYKLSNTTFDMLVAELGLKKELELIK